MACWTGLSLQGFPAEMDLGVKIVVNFFFL